MLSGNYDWNQFAGFQLNDQNEIFKDYLFSFKLPINITKDSAMKIFRENMLEFMDNLPLCKCEKSPVITQGLFNKLSFDTCSPGNSVVNQNKNQSNLQYHNKNPKDKLTEWDLENCYTFREFQKPKDYITNETENERVLKKRSRKASSLD